MHEISRLGNQLQLDASPGASENSCVCLNLVPENVETVGVFDCSPVMANDED